MFARLRSQLFGVVDAPDGVVAAQRNRCHGQGAGQGAAPDFVDTDDDPVATQGAHRFIHPHNPLSLGELLGLLATSARHKGLDLLARIRFMCRDESGEVIKLASVKEAFNLGAGEGFGLMA